MKYFSSKMPTGLYLGLYLNFLTWLELKNAVQGIFVTDVSDHYPIFYMNWRISAKIAEKYFTCRIMNRKSLFLLLLLLTGKKYM